MAAKKYYIDYHKSLQLERVRSLLDKCIPERFTQDEKSKNSLINQIVKQHKGVQKKWPYLAVS